MDSGTKMVGLNGVEVSIPDTWASDNARSGDPRRSGRTVSSFSGCVPGDPSRSSSVTLSKSPPRVATARPGDLRPAGRVGDHEVVESMGACQLSAPGRCSQWFGVPDLSAWFHVTVWSDQGGLQMIARIRDSLVLSGRGPQRSASPE